MFGVICSNFLNQLSKYYIVTIHFDRLAALKCLVFMIFQNLIVENFQSFFFYRLMLANIAGLKIIVLTTRTRVCC